MVRRRRRALPQSHFNPPHTPTFVSFWRGRPATGTVTVRANLSFPEEAKDRYPAVIVVHTLGGYLDANEGYVAAELRKSASPH